MRESFVVSIPQGYIPLRLATRWLVQIIRKILESKYQGSITGEQPMKKSYFPALIFLLVFLCANGESSVSSLYTFKNTMHQLYRYYSHIQRSYALKNYEITDMHLERLETAVKKLQGLIPEFNMDGSRVDKRLFMRRLDELHGKILDLRAAVEKREIKGVKDLSNEVFEMCTRCHEEVKLKFLRLPYPRAFFKEYMHRISENFYLAKNSMEKGKGDKATEIPFKLIHYYLTLLESTFPGSKLSDIISDRPTFDLRVKDLKGLSDEFLENVKEKKDADMELFRKNMNQLCVICHEPERTQ